MCKKVQDTGCLDKSLTVSWQNPETFNRSDVYIRGVKEKWVDLILLTLVFVGEGGARRIGWGHEVNDPYPSNCIYEPSLCVISDAERAVPVTDCDVPTPYANMQTGILCRRKPRETRNKSLKLESIGTGRNTARKTGVAVPSVGLPQGQTRTTRLTWNTVAELKGRQYRQFALAICPWPHLSIWVSQTKANLLCCKSNPVKVFLKYCLSHPLLCSPSTHKEKKIRAWRHGITLKGSK